jgi:thioredoxin reductase (NADPH)
MTAALNCLRAEKSVLVLEGDSFGGQIAFSPRVENFPSYPEISGAELMDKLYSQIVEKGAEIELERAEKIEKRADNKFFVKTDYNSYVAKSVIIATGVKHRPMGIAREEELVGKGVSYCAICDGAFYAGEDVVMIGDANTALQYAILLSGYCKSVTVCTLFDRFFGDKILTERLLQKPNVTVYHNLRLKELLGEDELSGAVFENTQSKTERRFDCKAAFICIGQIPDNKAFENIVELDKNGYIIADENCMTSCKGVFVAGDCRTKNIRQLVTAAADGGVAAFYACQYLDTSE